MGRGRSRGDGLGRGLLYGVLVGEVGEEGRGKRRLTGCGDEEEKGY